MKLRPLGSTGICVSEIGFGGWAIGGPWDVGFPVGWGKVDDDESIAAVRKALDLGINFFDTADVYGGGHSEELLGNALQKSDVILASKVGNTRNADGVPIKDFSEQHIRPAIERSLQRLRRETIDIYFLHNPPPEVWQKDEAFELLAKLKAEGKIRVRAVSVSTMEEAIHLVENDKVDALQVLINILNQEPAKKVLPLAEKKGIGIVARVPLASGLLTGKFAPDHPFPKDDNRINYLSAKRMKEALGKVEHLREIIQDSGFSMPQVALAFLLKFHAVSAPIPGAKTPAQVEQNASAAAIALSDELFHAIRAEFSGYNFYLRYGVRV